MRLSTLDLTGQQGKLEPPGWPLGLRPKSMLSPELAAMIGASSPDTQCWGTVDADLLRRFSQALMDPDPRYWDVDFAESSPQQGLTTPPVMAACLERRKPPGSRDILAQDRPTDESSGVASPTFQGLPPLSTHLRRVARTGLGIEVFSYPSIGDQIFVHHRYHSISEGPAGANNDGASTLLVTVESIYRNQDDRPLCKITNRLVRR